jgi:L-seryl-tRNA(Ser) seleniumtransferase
VEFEQINFKLIISEKLRKLVPTYKIPLKNSRELYISVKSQNNAFKALPSADKALQSNELKGLVDSFGRKAVKLTIREELDRLRAQISADNQSVIQGLMREQFFNSFCENVAARVRDSFRSSLLKVINLTGTVVHTNLGRARLPDSAIAAMERVAAHTTNLEYDLKSGNRGDRDSHVEGLLCEITGAEAATVVNNNAAAVLLVLNTMAAGKEVVISRGELVEIGGAFRIPDVMKSAGCILKEIGTTNRTHLHDYESAINPKTSLLMKVHTSNYEIRGFTNSIPESEISQLAHEKNLRFVSDLGSGTLVDLTKYGLPREPTVTETLGQGADIVTFSGDKLLGGPQSGLIVGKKELIEAIKHNALKRALRVDKTTVAALAEVLKIYRDPDRLHYRLPLLADLSRPLADIDSLARKIFPAFKQKLSTIANVSMEPCKSQIGSGALPLDLLESRAIVIKPLAKKGETDAALRKLAEEFRNLPVPVIGRIRDGNLVFDLRCLISESDLIPQLDHLTVTN